MPASPVTTTTCPSPCLARAQRRINSATSSSRPMSGTCAERRDSKRLAATLSPSTCQARIGCKNPFKFRGPKSAYSNKPPASSLVLGAMMIVFGSAIDCSRAAKFGVPPTIEGWSAAAEATSSPTTTMPVAIPTRMKSFSGEGGRLSMSLMSSSPALIARSASSSLTAGYPKYARMPSPWYRATRPPATSTIFVARCW